jgi:hypothetical protein
MCGIFVYVFMRDIGMKVTILVYICGTSV